MFKSLRGKMWLCEEEWKIVVHDDSSLQAKHDQMAKYESKQKIERKDYAIKLYK